MNCDDPMKKRMRQGSIPDLFKKMKKNVNQHSCSITSGATDLTDDEEVQVLETINRRELMAKAAERRLKDLPSNSEMSEGPEDEPSNSQSLLSETDEDGESGKKVSLGTDVRLLLRMPHCGQPLQLIDSRHRFLVDVKSMSNSRKTTVPPYPPKYMDKWDGHHVRMPCSSDNLYPVDDSSVPGGKKVESRWELITQTLQKPITSSLDFEEAVMSYNSRYGDKWNFRELHAFFSDSLDQVESQLVFSKIIPEIVKLALQLPSLCTQSPPLLHSGDTYALTLSQKQIACLLANAFFCTFPRRNTQHRQSEYANYPDINFISLFSTPRFANKISARQAEKLKCVLHYFLRVVKQEPVGCVTFQRQRVTDFPTWETSSTLLKRFHVTSEGTIEDEGLGMLEVDFANKFVGGGVLRRGCVQEEIRFIICPELIVSRLFTECLEDNECLIITGCERFSCYSGYADTFEWSGDYEDKTPRDNWGRRMTQIVAMDATHFRGAREQYREQWLRREINKAYCGFYARDIPSSALPAVATGNWGCGAFRGDPHLKCLLQLMAAAEAGRDLMYFTFHNAKLATQLHAMHEFLVKKNMTIGDIWKVLIAYQDFLDANTGRKAKTKLYEFIYETLTQPKLTVVQKDERIKRPDGSASPSEDGWFNLTELYGTTP